MGGICLLIGFLICGVLIMDALFSGKSGLIRLWLGLCAGLMLMMWLPVPFAYLMDFTLGAQLLASSRLQIQTVAQHCGISDANYFSKLFKKRFEMTPKQFRDRMNPAREAL